MTLQVHLFFFKKDLDNILETLSGIVLVIQYSFESLIPYKMIWLPLNIISLIFTLKLTVHNLEHYFGILYRADLRKTPH